MGTSMLTLWKCADGEFSNADLLRGEISRILEVYGLCSPTCLDWFPEKSGIFTFPDSLMGEELLFSSLRFFRTGTPTLLDTAVCPIRPAL